MPVRPLPENPDLQHLKYQAKDLLHDHAARKLDAAQRLREFSPEFSGAADAEIFAAHLRLSDAQLAIARERGFATWASLKRHIEKPSLADRLDLPYHERIEDPVFRRAVELLDTGDAGGLRAHLAQYPNLVGQHVRFEGGNYFRNPTLLEFIAENPVRHGTLPKNIVEITKVILDAGPEQSSANDALALVATGRVARECGVQIPLIGLLCHYGANPNTAVEASAAHGEFEAVQALIERGAKENLPIAAALGHVEHVHRLLADADNRERHLALAFAAQFGRVEIVRVLLDAGEDPNRYNPVGSHSHSTPLHQAAGYGHKEVVQLLGERGAKLNIRDTIWRATPAAWATHSGHNDVAEYLNALGSNSHSKKTD